MATQLDPRNSLGAPLTTDPVFELRTDPTSGRRVLIAEARANRPSDFRAAPEPCAAGVEEYHADCPFCRGNEHQTPHELATVGDAAGDWRIRVVPNKYPAVAPEAPLVEGTGTPLLPVERATGVHEVVIESPRHVHDWLDLPQGAVAGVLTMLSERLRVAFREHNLLAGQVFKNVGKRAGASLEHVHSQLLALPFVPAGLEAKLHLAARHLQAEGECLYCRLCREELTHGQRLVCQNAQFVAACAFAGRQPYEMWIMPRGHLTQFSELHEGDLATALAEIMQEVLRRLTGVIQPLAYNLVLHTAPAHDPRNEAFHWHWEVIPRTASLAGFEWGAGVFINSLSPERAAGRLRKGTQ